jgi:hypothetical protein
MTPTISPQALERFSTVPTTRWRLRRASATALAAAALLAWNPAAATNCAWQNGDGYFQDKKHWLNCFPGKDDNVLIGSPFAINSTAFITINRSKEEFHSLYIGAGAGINLYSNLLLHGNVLQNSGTVNLIGGTVRPYLRSYSKNLVVSTLGAINLYGGDIGGNFTFGSGQTISGWGTIGNDSNLLINNGTVQANRSGAEILFTHGIDGTGTYRALNGGRLHFTADSSGDTLVNNGLVQLDGVNFTVAKDYQGSYFGTGNAFDARRTVQGTGAIFAADARQVVSSPRLSGNTLDFGAMRVGAQVSTSLVVSNAGTLTTLRGAVQNTAAPGVAVTSPDFVLAPGGASHSSTLTFSGTKAGIVSGPAIDVVNNFSNVDDSHLAVTARVYAPAVAQLSSGSVSFGTVRQGATATAALTLTNGATGALTDSLVTRVASLPARVSATPPGPLAAGQSGVVAFSLNTATAGSFHGTGALSFASHDAELADLQSSQSLSFSGTVTELASAVVFKQGGAGDWSGAGDAFTLDLGLLSGSGGSVQTELALTNGNRGAAFSELLDGHFALSGPAAFSFNGVSLLSALAGGGSERGHWLGFDPAGLDSGRYSATLTFEGLSRFSGLSDLALQPITITVLAQVQAVPEPGSWALMLAGFGLGGAALGRRGRLRQVDQRRRALAQGHAPAQVGHRADLRLQRGPAGGTA